MPAQLVLVHDDPKFVEQCAAMLQSAGYHVAAFSDPLLALDALDAARTVELLITRVAYALGKPSGLALARMAKLRRPNIRVLFLALPENAVHIDSDWDEPLPLPTTPAALVEAVKRTVEKMAKNSK